MIHISVTVVDSIMGSGKTSWVINEILNKNFERNILYITPYLDEVQRVKDISKRKIYEPQCMGTSKLENISKLLSQQMDIASTHELFKRFDDNCKQALKDNKYTLILDKTLTAVTPYKFKNSDDFKYLIGKEEIRVNENGLIEWIGTDLDMRFNDVRTLSKNECLFIVDGKFYLWLFPHEIFNLFEDVYILTYLFDGSLMKYYFDLYNIKYQLKSIQKIDNEYRLAEFFKPDKQNIRERIKVYNGDLNSNLGLYKDTSLSATWCTQSYNSDKIEQLKNNLTNFVRHIISTSSNYTMWTTYKKTKSKLSNKGYARGFVPCNCRATNEFSDRTCLMYCCNWYEHPEIIKFFKQYNIEVAQDKTALSNLLQWIWRSNIRVPDSNKIIDIYIPSKRMRRLFLDWLNG